MGSGWKSGDHGHHHYMMLNESQVHLYKLLRGLSPSLSIG